MGIAIWVVAVLLISIIAFAYIKLEHHLHLLKFGALVLIIFLMAVSIFATFTSDRVDLSSPTGIINGVYLYVGWLGGFIGDVWSIGVSTTGQIISAVNVTG